MQLDPHDLTSSERYKILVGAVTPRPIAFVSSASPDGAVNLAPFSFFNAAGSDPMTLVFCPVTPKGGVEKDTLRNVMPEGEGGLGEFVVNVAVEPYFRQMAAAAEPLPRGESEFDLTGLTPAPSARIRPPRLAESPVSFECLTRQVIALNPEGSAGGGNLVIGEVVYVWIDDAIIDERMRIDPALYPTLGRLGGSGYARTRDIVSLPRGRDALDAELGFEPSPVGRR